MLWLAYAIIGFSQKDRLQDWGQFGDGFGALNCLFTGLALVGVVAAFWHEREQVRANEQATFNEMLRRSREQSNLIREMNNQVRAMNHATKFNAKKFRLERCLQQLHKPNLSTEQVTHLNEEIMRLEGELDRISDTDLL